LTDAKGASDRAAKLEKAKKFKKKLKLVAKKVKSAAKLKSKTTKELNVAKLKKDKTKIASITKKLEEIEDTLKSLGQQELVAKAKYNKAMGIKFKPSKKKVSAASFALKKVALKLGIQFDKENKLMDQKSALLLSNKKADEAKLEEVNLQLGELKKSIPQMDEEAALAREKVMIL
jgi:phosphoglycerate-specific signal transduction histidine kinase